MTKLDPGRYLVDDLGRAAYNRKLVGDKLYLDNYPAQAKVENLREPTLAEILAEILLDEKEELDKTEEV